VLFLPLAGVSSACGAQDAAVAGGNNALKAQHLWFSALRLREDSCLYKYRLSVVGELAPPSFAAAANSAVRSARDALSIMATACRHCAISIRWRTGSPQSFAAAAHLRCGTALAHARALPAACAIAAIWCGTAPAHRLLAVPHLPAYLSGPLTS